MKRIGYFDIETADWTIFVLGGILLEGKIERVWHDADSFRALLFERPNVEWRAHNGGRFDFVFVLEYAQRQGYAIKATMRGASILKATVSDECGRKVTFIDTFALAPVSLAKFAAGAGGSQKGEYDYRKIIPGMDRHSADAKELEDYLDSDLLSLRDADEAWRHVINNVAGVEPSLTIGGTAWKSASRYADECGEDVSAPIDIHSYNDGRAGYFGGRVEVYRTKAQTAHTCDRNSSYPAALVNQPVPVGARKWSRTWFGEDGTVWARVRVPECLVPPLPVRMGARLVFPTGEFDGVWTNLELRHAVNRCGVQLVKVYRARVAERTTDALAGWCSRVWRAREEMPKWNGLLKLLANSLTGKLAQSPERSGLSFAHVSDVPFGARQITAADKNGNVWFTNTTLQVSPCARPEWSAYLTSEARIELHAQLSSVGSAATYCDTDSVFATKPITRNMGTGLGQWKDEGIVSSFEAHGPKFYKYDKPDGEQISKAKGQSRLTREGFDALVAGAPWEDRAGANSIKQIIRDAGVAAFTTKHTLKGRKTDGAWVGSRLRGRTVATRAPTYSEAAARFLLRRK